MTGRVAPIAARADGGHWAPVADTYRREGIVVITEAIPEPTLEALRREAGLLRRQAAAALSLCGDAELAGQTANRHCSLPGRHTTRPVLADLIASDLMGQLCRATIGDPAWLFTDQFLMKGPHSHMDFNWHQDGAYVPVRHDPFVVVWLPIDNVDLDNGTIRAIPFSRLPEGGLRPHVPHPENHDLVGYEGDDPGDAVVCPAGSIVAFDSRVLHASEDNRSDRWRRVYQIRYTRGPILDEASGRPIHFAKSVFGA